MIVIEDQPIPIIQTGIGDRVNKGGGVEGMKGILVPFAEHEGFSVCDRDGSQAQNCCGHGADSLLHGQWIRRYIFRWPGNQIGSILNGQQRVVEIAVVFHHIAHGMAIHICGAGHQVAGNDGYFDSKRNQVILHILVKGPVHPEAKLHKVSVPGWPFRCVPWTHGLIDRLIEAALNAPDSASRRVFFIAQSAHTVPRPGIFHFFPGMVLHQQKIAEPTGHFLPVRLHFFSLISADIAFDS